MSQDAISNEDLAAMVDGPEVTQSASAGTDHKGRRVRPVDFTRPIKFTPDQIRRIKQAVDRFCQTTTTNLTAELRTVVECRLLDSEQLTWWDAQLQLPNDAVCGVVKGEPADIRMLMAADLPLVLGAIEHLLGGTGDPQPAERRLTDIDRRLAQRVFEGMIHQLSPCWQDLCGQQLELGDFDVVADDIQLAPGSEPTLMLDFEMTLPGGAHRFKLMLPWSAVAPVEQELLGQAEVGAGDDGQAAAAVQSVLRDVDVVLRAAAPAVELPLERVLALKPGDVVRLEASVEGGVTLFADDQPIHRATPGRNGARRAIQVQSRHEDSF